MKTISLLIFVILLATTSPLIAQDDWITMFDGKTLDGWKANENPDNWTVEDGVIVGRGPASHLFYMNEECQDCEFSAEVNINDKGNSGMFFRTEFGAGFPSGYEAQVNSTHSDWRRTGSLYDISDTKEQLVPPDTWFTQHVIVQGNHIIIKVNGKTVTDYVDKKNTHQKGYLALQQHDPGSRVRYRNLRMRHIK